MASSGKGSPCGACKFLRRKCLSGCVFAPYFSSEESPARFAAMHKVFGASNVSKILHHVPVHERCEVVVTMAYEAEARLHDPVYGCVSHVFALQQQVTFLQAQLMQLKQNLAHKTISTITEDLRNKSHTTWQQTNAYTAPYKPYSHEHLIKQVSSQSSIESLEHGEVKTNMQEIQTGRFGFNQDCYPNKKRPMSYYNDDLSELQAWAVGMMGNY